MTTEVWVAVITVVITQAVNLVTVWVRDKTKVDTEASSAAFDRVTRLLDERREEIVTLKSDLATLRAALDKERKDREEAEEIIRRERKMSEEKLWLQRRSDVATYEEVQEEVYDLRDQLARYKNYVQYLGRGIRELTDQLRKHDISPIWQPDESRLEQL